MNKFKYLLSYIFTLSIFLLILPLFHPAHAQNSCSVTPTSIYTSDPSWNFQIQGFTYNQIKEVQLFYVLPIAVTTCSKNELTDLGGNTIKFTVNNSIAGNLSGCHTGFLPDKTFSFKVIGVNGGILCQTNDIATTQKGVNTSCTITTNPTSVPLDTPYTVTVNNIPSNATGLGLWWQSGLFPNPSTQNVANGQAISMPVLSANEIVDIWITGTINGNFYDAKHPLCATQVTAGSNAGGGGGSASLGTTDICSFVAGANQGLCRICFAKPGVYTPFGCIETNPQDFVAKVLKIAIGIAGGIAFLMILYGGFVVMTSAGNPEKLTSGKEIITSAIAGLLMIVFSVVILRIIGVDILQIPGL